MLSFIYGEWFILISLLIHAPLQGYLNSNIIREVLFPKHCQQGGLIPGSASSTDPCLVRLYDQVQRIARGRR